MNHYHLYQHKSSYPKGNAQLNLESRTHYVDDDTLRYFKSRILYSGHTDGGLLFYIVESFADPVSGKRLFRGVIFDIAGNVVNDRASFDDAYKTSKQALKRMWEQANELDAVEITREAMRSEKRYLESQIERLEKDIEALISEAA